MGSFPRDWPAPQGHRPAAPGCPAPWGAGSGPLGQREAERPPGKKPGAHTCLERWQVEGYMCDRCEWVCNALREDPGESRGVREAVEGAALQRPHDPPYGDLNANPRNGQTSHP